MRHKCHIFLLDLIELNRNEIWILLAKYEKEVPKITQTLLIEPSFQMSTLYFLLGDSKHEDKQERNIKKFSFLNCKYK